MARSLGYYGNQQIQLVDLPSTSEVVRAYHDGLIDVAAVTSDEALSATQGQTNQRIVLVCDFSKGADVLLAKPGIASLQDLKGRRVGVETTVLGAYMLGRALERAGLSVSDVQVVPTPLLEHEAAYKSGTVDAVVTFEPHRSRLLAAGAHTLFDSSEIPGEIVDVLLTRRDLSPSQNRAVATLVSGWFRSLAYLQKNPSDAAARMAQREAVTPQEFLASLQGLELPDRAANLRLLEGPSGTLNDTLGRLSAVMVRQNMASQQITPPVLDASFVKMAEP
jgi:NitT/TauT family transport system substrate-binding protein